VPVAFFEIKWKTSLSGVWCEREKEGGREGRREGERERERERDDRSRVGIGTARLGERGALSHLLLVSFSHAVSFSQPAISRRSMHTTEYFSLSPSSRSLFSQLSLLSSLSFSLFLLSS